MTLYDILEVSPNASPAVIRAAYKSLMQRYHPDKNPGDRSMAEQASRVVQAYEVLSDPDKRAAYDRDLRQQQRQPGPTGGSSGEPRSAQPGSGVSRPASRMPTRTTPGRKAATWLPPGPARWLAICALLLALAMVAVVLHSKKPAPAPETPVASAPNAAAASAPATGPTAGSTTAPANADALSGPPQSLEIPAYLRRLNIPLKNPQRPEETTGHVLYIPVITVKVGSLDAASAIKHLNNTAEQIVTKLQDSLALSPIEALNPVDGDAYLARSILTAINATIGTATPEKPATAIPAGPNPPPEGARYGVVEVSLPERFSVR